MMGLMFACSLEGIASICLACRMYTLLQLLGLQLDMGCVEQESRRFEYCLPCSGPIRRQSGQLAAHPPPRPPGAAHRALRASGDNLRRAAAADQGALGEAERPPGREDPPAERLAALQQTCL